MGNYVLAYDVGTTGIKTCLIEIDKSIKILSSASQGYQLYVLPGGGAEQDPEEWWDAMKATTRRIFENSSVKPEQVGCREIEKINRVFKMRFVVELLGGFFTETVYIHSVL